MLESYLISRDLLYAIIFFKLNGVGILIMFFIYLLR